jgi:hypothetical protein
MTTIKIKNRNYLKTKGLKNEAYCWVPVAHACNPSYSGGRDQEDHGLKPAPGKLYPRLYLEKPFTKKGWWSGSRCRP